MMDTAEKDGIFDNVEQANKNGGGCQPGGISHAVAHTQSHTMKYGCDSE